MDSASRKQGRAASEASIGSVEVERTKRLLRAVRRRMSSDVCEKEKKGVRCGGTADSARSWMREQKREMTQRGKGKGRKQDSQMPDVDWGANRWRKQGLC